MPERPNKTDRARALRRAQSRAEAALWARLRGRRLADFKFVRQEPVGPFFADFCCREARLIVEVDGATHAEDAERAYDARRTQLLNALAYRVLRVTNDEIYRGVDDVCETILAALEARA